MRHTDGKKNGKEKSIIFFSPAWSHGNGPSNDFCMSQSRGNVPQYRGNRCQSRVEKIPSSGCVGFAML